MSAELGIGLALRAVNERVQQAVARRPRVRTEIAWGRWAAAWRRGTPGGGLRRHGDAEGSPGGAGRGRGDCGVAELARGWKGTLRALATRLGGALEVGFGAEGTRYLGG